MSDISLVYARLKALDDNLPNDGSIHQKYVFEYNELLSEIEKSLKIDLAKFRVPDSELVRDIISALCGGNHNYSDYLVCDRDYLKMKISGLLNLFYITENKTEIGFNIDR